MEYEGIKTSFKMPKKSNTKFTGKEYTAINGPSAAVRKFQTSHPHLKFGESQARALRKKHLDQQKKSSNSGKKIATLKRGRPLMLGALDEKVRNFLQIVRREVLLTRWLQSQQLKLLLKRVTNST